MAITTTQTGLTGGSLFEPWGQNQPQPTQPSLPVAQLGDLLVRKVQNGWLVKKVGGYGTVHQTYVATDVEQLCDVIKLASVSGVISKAK